MVIDSCTGVSGKITYSPGLVKVKKPLIHAVMTGTTSGCADIFNGPESGTGTFTAVLSGHANLSAENFSGTFTINWPAAFIAIRLTSAGASRTSRKCRMTIPSC